ncbi:CAZyme family GH105 [Trichoderma harzianum]|nr:CAZyme family GH105 [Trichoderma harzianum]
MTSNGTDTGSGTSQSKPYSIWMAESVIARGQGLASPDGDSGQWLRIGFFQTALLEVLSANGLDDMVEQRERVLDYLECGTRKAASLVLDAKRNVTFSLDRLSLGRGLSFQYERSKDELYKNALDALRESIDLQPRNHFVVDEASTKPTTHGLFVHGYDSSQKYEWSHNKNGASPFVWGRSLAWLTLALLAALESPTMSKDSAKWENLKSKFQYLIKKVVHCRDSKSNGWWQLMCSPDLPGNYIESSCSSIFVFVILRGSRLGFLESLLPDDNIEKAACEAYDAIVRKFVVKRDDGTLGLNGTVDVCSLNSPASYDYYLSRPIQQDSVLGTSAFVLASLERERYTGAALD